VRFMSAPRLNKAADLKDSMKTLFCTLMLAILSAAAANASLLFSFDDPNQTAIPGQTLQFLLDELLFLPEVIPQCRFRERVVFRGLWAILAATRASCSQLDDAEVPTRLRLSPQTLRA
jgi:hypothetical protein